MKTFKRTLGWILIASVFAFMAIAYADMYGPKGALIIFASLAGVILLAVIIMWCFK